MSPNTPSPLNPSLAEELLVLSSIYGSASNTLTLLPSSPSSPAHDLLLLQPRSPSKTTSTCRCSFILSIPPTYPSLPPIATSTASTGNLPKGVGAEALGVLRAVIDRTWRGEVCLFDVVEEVAGLLGEGVEMGEEIGGDGVEAEDEEEKGMGMESARRRTKGGEADPLLSRDRNTHHPHPPGNQAPTDARRTGPGVSTPHAPATPAPALASTLSPPSGPGLSPGSGTVYSPTHRPPPPLSAQTWIVCPPSTCKKSVFIAHCHALTQPAQAGPMITSLITSSKKLSSATHHISAWRVLVSRSAQEVGVVGAGGGAGVQRVEEDFDDDGESGAGMRVLAVLQKMGAVGVLVVVSRWFGGVKLGGERFRIIGGVAREVLVKGGWGVGAGAGAGAGAAVV